MLRYLFRAICVRVLPRRVPPLVQNTLALEVSRASLRRPGAHERVGEGRSIEHGPGDGWHRPLTACCDHGRRYRSSFRGALHTDDRTAVRKGFGVHVGRSLHRKPFCGHDPLPADVLAPCCASPMLLMDPWRRETQRLARTTTNKRSTTALMNLCT